MRIRRFTHALPFAALVVLAACGTNTSETVGGPAPAANTAVTLGSPEASTPSPADAPAAAPAASPESIVLTRDQDYSTGQSGITLTVRCDGGGDITIGANDVRVQASGNCEDIDIDGNGNSVVAENVDDLDVDGSGNTVQAATARTVEVDGGGNTVRVASTTDIEVEGNANTVTYGGGNPSIENEGDNVVAVG